MWCDSDTCHTCAKGFLDSNIEQPAPNSHIHKNRNFSSIIDDW